MIRQADNDLWPWWNYETAIEVAYDYFDEAKAKTYEESEEEEDEG